MGTAPFYENIEFWLAIAGILIGVFDLFLIVRGRQSRCKVKLSFDNRAIFYKSHDGYYQFETPPQFDVYIINPGMRAIYVSEVHIDFDAKNTANILMQLMYTKETHDLFEQHGKGFEVVGNSRIRLTANIVEAVNIPGKTMIQDGVITFRAKVILDTGKVFHSNKYSLKVKDLSRYLLPVIQLQE